MQNYPNPFNPQTTIKFVIPKNEFITLTVYDNRGKKIRTFINKEMTSGLHSLSFDGNNLPSGLYFYRIAAGSFSDTKKFLLLK